MIKNNKCEQNKDDEIEINSIDWFFFTQAAHSLNLRKGRRHRLLCKYKT